MCYEANDDVKGNVVITYGMFQSFPGLGIVYKSFRWVGLLSHTVGVGVA